MQKRMKDIIRLVLGRKIWNVLRNIRYRWRRWRQVKDYYKYDADRFLRYSGAVTPMDQDSLLAAIIMKYHIIEKGLTMPNRRFIFGRNVLLELMELIGKYEGKYGRTNMQVNHASGVIAEYLELHESLIHEDSNTDLMDFLSKVKEFTVRHDAHITNRQRHLKKSQFYKGREASFEIFSRSRHTLRHYSERELSVERVASAVEIALSAPSACNRQYCRVHCISNKDTINDILAIHNGNRGFGHLASKLLVVTSDMQGILSIAEHNDVYTNGGMFLMNLCYALYYREIAHCVLNWSRSPESDVMLRKIIKIKPSEVVVALVACGETPEEFDVAASPRKQLSDILVVH